MTRGSSTTGEMDVKRKEGSRHGTQNSRQGNIRSGPGSFSYLPIPAFQKIPWVTAAISVRLGGVSQHPYHWLNLAYHVDDVDASVAENRRRFCAALGIDVRSLIMAQQVHGDRVAIVDESQAGRGACRHADAIPETDAMVTASRSVALAVLTADCVPVLVVDPVREAIGIAHAGWRGTLSMIAAGTVLKMQDAFGTDPADCLIVLGPAIGPCCYTVGADVALQFQHTFPSAACVIEARLDLRQAIRTQLTAIGVETYSISSVGGCTACDPALFYSYRGEGGRTGRMMSVIGIFDS